MKQIYMLGGKARSGKDTIAGFIKKYYEQKSKKCIIIQISTYIKYYAKKVLNWDESEETKPREFLQTSGTMIRETFGQDFFINRIIDDIKILFNYADIIVVSDVRLPLEFDMVKNTFDNVKNIYVKRDDFDNNLGDRTKHITEVALDNFKDYDYIISNNSDLESLRKQIYLILKEEVK